MPHKKLFIPGPIEVHPDVLKAMSTPMIGHRSGDYSELQKRVTEKIQKLAFTSHPVLFSASSGSGLMEGAIRCCTAKRAIVFSVGHIRQPVVRDRAGQRRAGGQARGGVGRRG